MRRTDVAEHEAAHVVVGASLGLPFKRAKVGREEWRSFVIEGLTWFGGRCWLAHGITACAGVVWERREGGSRLGAAADRRNAQNCFDQRNISTGCKAAADILRTRGEILERVARELCDRDLGPAELAELAVGG